MKIAMRCFKAGITLALVLACRLLYCQAPGTGAITGTVYDPAGAVVQQSNIVLKSDSTGAIRTAASNASGAFTFALLPPGSYTVSISATGFVQKSATVNVVVAETSVVDFHLPVESASASITVEPTIELAQTESSALGRAVDHQTIEALPLSNRNYTQILSLSPGVVVELPNASALGRGTQNVAANGNKTTGNNIQFNGVDANNLSQNSAASDREEVGVAAPAPDTIQEFKVQTGNYDASYGRGTGANVDVVSKSGTITFHGTG